MTTSQQPLRDRERAEESAAAVAHYISHEREPRRRNLMLMDYAAKSRSLDDPTRLVFHQMVISSLLPSEQDRDVRRGISVPRPDVEDVDVLILTVQPIELRATLAALEMEEARPRVYKDRSFFGRELSYSAAGLARARSKLSVVVTSVGQPLNLRCLQTVYEISEVYRPTLWVLAGMAAGVTGTKLGDVYIPESAWYYEPGRLMKHGFEPRPDRLHIGRVGRQLTNFDPYASDAMTKLSGRLRSMPTRYRPADIPDDFRPAVSVGSDAIASGEKVLRDGKTLARLHQSNQLIKAVDQESYGFAFACEGLNWLITRGIADHGDPDKDDRWQYGATMIAASVLIDFLQTKYIPPGVVKAF
jgi:nucleoside phosphorylase